MRREQGRPLTVELRFSRLAFFRARFRKGSINMKFVRVVAAWITALVLAVLLPGCAGRDAELAARGKASLMGLSQTDMRMCAGFPNNTGSFAGEDFWMYEHAAAPSGVFMPAYNLPWGGQIGAPGGGYCRVQLRFVRGKVVEATYAGQTEIWGSPDAACAPIVKTCIDYAVHRTDRSAQRTAQ